MFWIFWWIDVTVMGVLLIFMAWDLTRGWHAMGLRAFWQPMLSAMPVLLGSGLVLRTMGFMHCAEWLLGVVAVPALGVAIFIGVFTFLNLFPGNK